MGHINLLFTSITLLLILHLAFSAEEYQTIGLNEHNKYRKDHGVDDLTMSEKLNELAVKCAGYYLDNPTEQPNHSCPERKQQNLGENIYSAWASGGGGDKTTYTKTAIKKWYDEIDDYDWNNPSLVGKGGKQVGHFTQLVWKASKELGIGHIDKKDTKGGFSTVVVAHYAPPGNYDDEAQLKENVLSNGGSKATNEVSQWILLFFATTFFTLRLKEFYN